jgi:hypothetical protein
MKQSNKQKGTALSKTVCQYTLPFHPDRKITLKFDGGKITSDAGLALLYSLDRGHGISRSFAGCLGDTRDQRYTRHSMEHLTAQRTLQIAAGYEDVNDADSLRRDGALKSFCDKLPKSSEDLASGSTLCRLENSVSWRDVWRIHESWVGSYVKKLKKTRPEKIVLDLDSTDDQTHGQQEFSFYHGYFRHHVFHPLLMFDGETGDLLAAVLRGGNRGAAYRAVPVLRRIVERIREAIDWDLEIEIRADSGFATPELYEYCEENHLTYEIGFARNSRAEAQVEELMEEARTKFEKEQVKQRLFTEFEYQANSWDRPRRMIAKVEVNSIGTNRRFVVTNRKDLSAEDLYDRYIERGQSENYIKALKRDLKADRLSCHRFVANQFRLLLHGLAYQLFLTLRQYLEGTPWKNLAIETLRRRILKIGARIRETTRRIWIQCSSAYPEQRTFMLVLERICARPG